MEMTFPIPDFGSWTFGDWSLSILIGNAIYGLFTHWVSLPGVYKHNKKCSEEKIQPNLLFWYLLVRITLQLPLRLISLCIGLFVLLGEFVATLSLRKNRLLKIGFSWYCNPQDMAPRAASVVNAFSCGGGNYGD